MNDPRQHFQGQPVQNHGAPAGNPAQAPQNQNLPAGSQNQNQLAQKTDIGKLIEGLKPQLARALPQHITAERLARIALTAVRQNPKLQNCDGTSLLAAIMTSAQLGLEPNTPLGHAYIIPYGREATFQVGYKGLLDLSQRSGQFRRIQAYSVDEADQFDFAYGLDERLRHIPAEIPSGKLTHFYALYELTNGGRSFVVWSAAKIVAHAKQFSKSYSDPNSPWHKNFESMAKKTVLIDLLRYAPKSVELARAMSADETVSRFNPAEPDHSFDSVFSGV